MKRSRGGLKRSRRRARGVVRSRQRVVRGVRWVVLEGSCEARGADPEFPRTRRRPTDESRSSRLWHEFGRTRGWLDGECGDPRGGRAGRARREGGKEDLWLAFDDLSVEASAQLDRREATGPTRRSRSPGARRLAPDTCRSPCRS